MAYRKRHRGTTYQRGYGPAHRKLKDQWRPTVEEGHAYCHATICLLPTRWIQPGTPWHLGHTPDRTGWTGPEHQRCGAADGARRGNSRRGQTRGWFTSRRW
jgi:hypothetical protein